MITEGNAGINIPLEGSAIVLPASLFQQLGNGTNVGIFFGLYETASLFPVKGANFSSKREEVYSHVLAATIGQNLTIQNLEEPVNITFKVQSEEGRVSYHCSK